MPLCQPRDLAEGQRRRQEHRELIATEARYQALSPDLALQPTSDRHENLVAYRVSKVVVDVLEVIEVKEQEGGALLGTLGKDLLEVASVGEPRERVVLGLVCKLVFDVLALGDIGENAFPHDGAIGEIAGARLGPDPPRFAVQDNATFFAEGQLVFENVGVFAHPLGMVVGMHAGEGIHRVFPSRLAIQSRQLEEACREEGKIGHTAVGRLHHGVGSDGNVLRQIVSRLGERLLRSAQFPRALLNHVFE